MGTALESSCGIGTEGGAGKGECGCGAGIRGEGELVEVAWFFFVGFFFGGEGVEEEIRGV